jgi:hypothetical protein
MKLARESTLLMIVLCIAACGPAVEGIPSAQAQPTVDTISYPSPAAGSSEGQVFEYY